MGMDGLLDILRRGDPASGLSPKDDGEAWLSFTLC
jgi:hypothetical protein